MHGVWAGGWKRAPVRRVRPLLPRRLWGLEVEPGPDESWFCSRCRPADVAVAGPSGVAHSPSPSPGRTGPTPDPEPPIPASTFLAKGKDRCCQCRAGCRPPSHRWPCPCFVRGVPCTSCIPGSHDPSTCKTHGVRVAEHRRKLGLPVSGAPAHTPPEKCSAATVGLPLWPTRPPLPFRIGILWSTGPTEGYSMTFLWMPTTPPVSSG